MSAEWVLLFAVRQATCDLECRLNMLNMRSRVERRIHIFEMALTASLFMNKGTGAPLLGSAVFQEPRLLVFEIFERDERPRATCYIKRSSFSAATGPTRRARSIRRAVSSEIGLEGEKLWSRSCEAGDEKSSRQPSSTTDG